MIRAYDEAENVIEPHETRAIRRTLTLRETKSRHAVKHDGSLFRLIDQLSDCSGQFAVQACALQVRQGRTRCGELGTHFLDLRCLLP